VWTVKGRGLSPTPNSEKKNRPSTSSPLLLVHCSHDTWVLDLIRWRKKEKVLNTYLSKFPVLSHEGRLYGRFNQTGTKTGRLSSSGPNLQNVPAHGDLGPRVRALFRGNLVVGDYSQLEPRLMAHFSGDPVLLDTYRTGKDIYLVTAEGIFGRKFEKDDPERQVCKTLILALGYGAGPDKLAQILTINGHPTDSETAVGYLRELGRLYRRFFDWKEAVVASVHDKGYVKTLAGRHRRLRRAFKDRTNWRAIGYGERQAVNAIIQGSAGDIVRRAMLRMADTTALNLLAQVHDELVWDYDPADFGMGPPDGMFLSQVKKACEEYTGFDLRVPLIFEPFVVNSWAEKGGVTIELPDDDEEEE